MAMVHGSSDTASNPTNDFQWKDMGCADAPPTEVAPLCQLDDDNTGSAEELATTTTATATATAKPPPPSRCMPGWSKFGDHCYLAKLFPKD
jgi:hypothetical protein